MSELNLSHAHIAVIGSGTMGIGIVQLAITHGHPTTLYDLDAVKLRQAIESLQQTFAKLVVKGKMTQEQVSQALERLNVVDQIEQLDQAKLVIEAIVEKKEAKQFLFQELADICSIDTIFASNTSSISITAIAATIPHPERVVGLHFFNPAPVMKLVEVVEGLKTSQKLSQALKKLMLSWAKIPVITKSTPGFIVNRIARPFYAEGFRALQEQAIRFDQLDYALKQCGGFTMGPCELTDLIGQDINFSVTHSVYQAFFDEPRYRPSLVQKELVDAGCLGRKSQQGFYQYDDKNQYVDFQPELKTIENFTAKIYSQGCWSNSSALLERFDLNQGFIQDENIIVIDDIQLRLTQGESANIAYPHQKVVLLDWHHDFEKATGVVLSHNILCQTTDLNKIEAFFARYGVAVLWVKDHPGLFSLRSIVLLINEACEASLHGIATEEDIDNAMKYGVNYPEGPFQWLAQIGAGYVLRTLNHLYQGYGEEKYRASLYLKQYIAKNQPIALKKDNQIKASA